jgi:hypothetical protein
MAAAPRMPRPATPAKPSHILPFTGAGERHLRRADVVWTQRTASASPGDVAGGAALSCQVGMSERSFSRRYAEATSPDTPARRRAPARRGGITAALRYRPAGEASRRTLRLVISRPYAAALYRIGRDRSYPRPAQASCFRQRCAVAVCLAAAGRGQIPLRQPGNGGNQRARLR